MYNRALKLIREYHRMSRTEVANKLGLSKSYVSELERDKKPTIDVIEKYAEAFNIPVSSLMIFAENSNNSRSERFRTFAASKVINMLDWLHEIADEDEHAESKKLKKTQA
ncbi:helix-turn-helix domain protein [Variibacter gotjawalensis]|uniref:Helix-turn-helix domain protein n=1 Tax=Variibacter gotjawalensis TaxID=1333996 RepID=A0A0S3PNU9_9BRAD|nr:helix-turn-helix transcriptional regulator [Variibacter gotjawalensis]NIK47832.1 transcriptional regulator with XRE-family HTH domain [Variibacter gotjawalensis]RZS49719.1 DNA-binding XRE family transcriptional regulator [Variibacter gotjawalensis]BAT57548.1 helix-turn-helix domain protein [Variibacter gotjawalensis]